jgi:hypothetical protein
VHALQFSVVGYWVDQFTDDELNGRQFLDGHRSQVFAVGPQVRYTFAKGGIAFKWLHETSADNRPDGERLQLQFAVPFESEEAGQSAPNLPICARDRDKKSARGPP